MRWTPFLVLFLLLALAGCGSDDRPSLAEQAEASDDTAPVEEVALTAPTIVSASGTAVAQDEPLPVGPPGDEKFILVLPEDETDTEADTPPEPIQVIVDEPVEIDLADDELPLGPPGSVEAGPADADDNSGSNSDDALPTGPPGDSDGPDLVIDFGDDLPEDAGNDGPATPGEEDDPVGLARVIAEAKAAA